MPDASRESKVIMKRVKDITVSKKSIEEGLKAWEESFKAATANAEKPEQVMVDHWSALEYLHKLQYQVEQQQENERRGHPVDENIKAIAASTTILTRMPSRLATPTPMKSKPKKGSSPTEPASSSAAAASPTASPGTSPAADRASPLAAASASSPSPRKSKPSASSSATGTSTAPPATSSSPLKSRRAPLIQKLSDLAFAKGDSYDKIVEANGKPVKHLKPGAEFNNWGKTVKNTPAITFEPETRTGVCNVVKWAVAHGKRVRAAGYRHTWSSIYGEDDGVMLSMIPADRATGKSYTPLPKPNPQEDDLEGVTFLGEENGVGYARIGASTTNDQFRVWALQNDWTIPMSVDLVEISFGGSTSPMAHGTGLTHPTMADLVTEVEFVNANGELQRVTSANQMRAAAGALGVMGVIVAVVMKLERMTYAQMKPYKTPAVLAVPPPPPEWCPNGKSWPIPGQLDIHASLAQLKGAQKTFETQIEHDFYNEYFWFPFQPKSFVNCWHNDGDKAKSKTMSNCTALSQDVQGTLGSAANAVLGAFQSSGKFMTHFVTWSAVQVLPDMSDAKEPETTPVIEAYYFRRGLHNMTMWDMEMIIPIPGRKDKPDKPDWCVINRAWWDCINKIYEYAERDEYPVRLGLAMHIISDSNMIMAPENGNKVSSGKHKTFGTLTINISTVPQTPKELWERFSQDLANAWQSYTFPDGTPLNVRAHWVKQWEFLKALDGTPLPEHYRKVSYKDQIPDFLQQLKKIASAGNYQVKDMRKTFSNPLLDSIIWPGKS